MNVRKIYLIDGHSQLFKAFFAVRGLTSPDGMPTNAIFGFAQIINRLISEFSPTHLCVCFDLPGKTFRNDLYADYKANRPPAPEDLNTQTPHAKRFVIARGIRSAEMEGFESDDILVTLANRAVQQGFHVYIVSSDKDLLQAVNDKTTIVRMEKNRFDFIDSERVRKDYGLPPEMMTDFQGLMGDSTDNIPGVPGIGPKTAAKLLDGMKSLDDLLAHTDRVENARWRALLQDHAEKARLSKRLATLRNDLELDFDIEDCAFDDKPTRQLYEFYNEMGFTRLRDSVARELGLGAAKEKTAEQGSLFDIPEQTSSAPALAPVPLTSAKPASTDTEIIWTRPQLEALAGRLRKAKRFAVDTETTSSNPMRAELAGISLSCEWGKAAYVPVGHRPEVSEKTQLSIEIVREVLGPLFADASVAKIAQNAKYDMHVLERHGLAIKGLEFDPMIASYLIDPEGQHGLKPLARQWLGIEMTPITELIGSGKGQITMAEVSVADAARYSGADADMTLGLVEPLSKEMDKAALTRMFEEIEMPLIETLERMERRGVRVDAKRLAKSGAEIERSLDQLRIDACKLAGQDFNLDSTQQLARILFEDLGLPGKKRGQTGLSTDVSVLEELAEKHPLPKLMLEYRTQKKLKSTYFDTLPKMIDPKTGRIHTSFNQTIAATGRLSSSDPNLQNIPVRTPLGRKVRESFLPSKDGNVLVAADYSQIELRILAHITQEPGLVKAFENDLDVHALTASKIFGVEPAEVTGEMRSQAKTVNFGVIYGMSAMRLSRQLSISMGQATRFIKDYFAAYPGVKEWTKRVVQEARERGYVTTLSGRRRYLKDLGSQSPAIRANAERIAVNTPIQGTAADMIKIAMLRLDRRLEETDLGGEMILQVHDELVFDAHQERAKNLAEIVALEMRQALPLSVPLKVDIKIGSNWAEC
jgi:DNA polymerase I